MKYEQRLADRWRSRQARRQRAQLEATMAASTMQLGLSAGLHGAMSDGLRIVLTEVDNGSTSSPPYPWGDSRVVEEVVHE